MQAQESGCYSVRIQSGIHPVQKAWRACASVSCSVDQRLRTVHGQKAANTGKTGRCVLVKRLMLMGGNVKMR